MRSRSADRSFQSRAAEEPDSQEGPRSVCALSNRDRGIARILLPRRISAWGWRRQRQGGNAVEISGLPRGKVGVTPWKTRGYPVENSAYVRDSNAESLLYVLSLARVIDEFTRRFSREK